MTHPDLGGGVAGRAENPRQMLDGILPPQIERRKQDVRLRRQLSGEHADERAVRRARVREGVLIENPACGQSLEGGRRPAVVAVGRAMVRRHAVHPHEEDVRTPYGGDLHLGTEVRTPLSVPGGHDIGGN
jgi:hypothetical protein